MMLDQRHPQEFLPLGIMLASTVSTGGTTSASEYRGASLSTASGTSTHYEYTYDGDGSLVQPTSPNPDTVDFSAFPLIKRAAGFSGYSDVRIGNSKGKINYSLDFTTYTGFAVSSITATISGSYYRYSEEAVLSLLSSGGTKAAFIGDSRNASSWWPQLTGIPFSTESAGRKCGPLITPRHLLGVDHFRISNGSTVTFLTAAGVPVTRTVLSRATGPHPFEDAVVYVLNESLPGTISPLPVIGSWASLVSDDGSSYSFAEQAVGIFLDQNRECCFCEAGSTSASSRLKPSGSYHGVDLSTQVPIDLRFAEVSVDRQLPSLDAYRASYKTYASNGDSGSAVLFPVSGGWAVGCAVSTSAGGVFPHEELLNALIAQADAAAGISTGLTVTVAPDPTA